MKPRWTCLGFSKDGGRVWAPTGYRSTKSTIDPDAATLRSRRFEDATFAKTTDGSLVTLEHGVITSTWGEYSWRASAISDGYARFEPVNAPSAFSWRRIHADSVEVTQKWTDDQGVEQSYTLLLKRAP